MQVRVGLFTLLLVLVGLSATLAIEFLNVTVTTDVFGVTQYPGVIFQAGGDCIAVTDQSQIDNNQYIRILRRNSTSQYDEVYQQLASAFDVTTNGNWHGYLKGAYSGSGYYLFQLDASNEATNLHYLPDLSNGFGTLLSDNTFVFVNATFIWTYAYQNGNWSLIQQIPSNGTKSYYKFSFHADANTMTGFSTNLEQTNGSIMLWTRQADLTWSLAETINFNDTIYPTWARWNGGDTVFVGDPGNRFLRIYTKNNGEWTYEKYPQSLAGITGVGYFPSMSALIDQDTIVFNAPQDGYTVANARVGASVLMTRVNGVWNFTTVFKSDSDLYLFSVGVDVNDFDIVFYSAVSARTTTFSTVPLHAGSPPVPGASNGPSDGNGMPPSSVNEPFMNGPSGMASSAWTYMLSSSVAAITVHFFL